jgi:hypothetical protein
MQKEKKRILLISYHYPPSSAVGGMRIYGFAKYLTELGWEVNILTVDRKYIQNFDYERYKRDRRIEEYKTEVSPKISKIILYTIKRLGYKKNSISNKNYLSNENYDKKTEETKEKTKNRIKRFIDSFLLLPDENRNWIIPALYKAEKIIKEKKINIVLTSCPPYSVHIIGLILKGLIKIKWIADYRDPWITPYNKYLYPTCKVSLAIEKILETLVIKKADSVISTTKNLNDKFIEIYKEKIKNKFFYLSNGFDSNIIENKKDDFRKYDKFTISYTGTLYYGRSPESIFKAINQLKAEMLIRNGDVRVKLVGNCKYTNDKKTEEIIRKYRLEDEVEINTPVNYKKAIKITGKSQLGLVLAPKQTYQIPAKIYDLIGAETKALAITGDGATKDMVEKLGIGKCFHWSDIEGIKKYIYDEYSNKSEENTQWKKIQSLFTQKNLVKELDLLLNRFI